RPRRDDARAGPRDARHHDARRGVRRGARHAVGLTVADSAGRRAGGGLRDAAHRARGHRARLRRPRGRRPDGVAQRGAGGGMTSTTSTATPGRRTVPNGLWGMLLFVTTEAVLLTTLVGTYLYL